MPIIFFTYLSLYYLDNTVHPLPHALPVYRVQKRLQFSQKARIVLKVVEMVVHPVPQDVQHPEKLSF